MIKNGQPQVYAILKVWKMLGSFDEQLSQEPISATSLKKGFRYIELKCFIQNEAQNINDPKLGDSQVVTVRRPALSWAPLPSFSYRGAKFSYSLILIHILILILLFSCAPPIFLLSRVKILLLRRPFSVAVSLWLICALLWNANCSCVEGGARTQSHQVKFVGLRIWTPPLNQRISSRRLLSHRRSLSPTIPSLGYFYPSVPKDFHGREQKYVY